MPNRRVSSARRIGVDWRSNNFGEHQGPPGIRTIR